MAAPSWYRAAPASQDVVPGSPQHEQAIFKALTRTSYCHPHGSHAAAYEFLTDPMRKPGGPRNGPPGSHVFIAARYAR